jgi:hypothetical protein
VAGGLQQLPALGVGLHDRVLDAVVDHLGEVARPVLTGVDEPELSRGLEGVEDRLDLRHGLHLAADHERIALGDAPHAP